MDSIFIFFWTDFGVILGIILDPEKMDRLGLPPLEKGLGRVLFLKMQVLGGVGVYSDIQITNKGVVWSAPPP